MININFEKFSGFYSSKIEPILFDLEKERKKLRLYFLICDGIFIFAVILFVLFFIIFAFFRNYVNVTDEQVIILWVGVPFGIFMLSLILRVLLEDFIYKKLRQYIRKLKTKIHTKIFKLLDLDYKPSASPEFADYQNAVLKFLKKDSLWAKLVCSTQRVKLLSHIMQFEDGISGIYKDIPFELADVTIISKDSDNMYYSKSIFEGLMLAVKIDKPFQKRTIVKTNNFNIFDIKKKVINLEDIEFKKNFKVFADDEVESRYLLTTSFMERLRLFHKKQKDKTIIFFDNSCSESKNMFILTNTGKDNFEIPFNKSILNEKYYYNLLKELVDMLEIAVALKLEQNIGL